MCMCVLKHNKNGYIVYIHLFTVHNFFNAHANIVKHQIKNQNKCQILKILKVMFFSFNNIIFYHSYFFL